MTASRGLKRVIEGAPESDEPTYFAYSATLRIFGEALPFEELTQMLGVEPTTTHREGERRRPGSEPNKHDLWMFSPDLQDERPLFEHIDSLWGAIRHRKDYLLELKSRATVDVFLGYRSNVDSAGVEIPHPSLEMFQQLEIPVSISIIIT